MNTLSSRHLHPVNDSSAFQKRWITVVEKTTVFRSSAVISATRALPIPAEVIHGHFHHTATPTQGRADSQPLTNRPYEHHNPDQALISTSLRPCGPCPTRPTTISAAPNPATARPAG